MRYNIFTALEGYGLTALFIADFIALIIFHNDLTLAGIFGLVFILGAVKFYFGTKNMKSFGFTVGKGLRVEYYRSKKQGKR